MGEAQWRRYAPWTTVGDMALAVPTLAFFAYLLVSRPLAWWGYSLVAVIMVASVWFFGQALIKALSRYSWNDQGLSHQLAGGPIKQVAWDQLCDLQLRHFGTRRNRGSGGGRAELRLGFAGERPARLCLDSFLDDFSVLVAFVEHAAKKNRLDLDEAVWEGLAVLAGEADLPGEETSGEEKREGETNEKGD